MIVDDNVIKRDVLVKTLSPSGFELLEAGDRQADLAKTVVFRTDLILLGLRMPGMDGSETMVRIRELPNGEDIKIITITASAFEKKR